MTKYSCDIHTAENWESIALFSDKVSFEAMGAFIGAEFECGNSLCAPCDAIRVVDLTTSEVVLEAEVGDAEDYEPADIPEEEEEEDSLSALSAWEDAYCCADPDDGWVL